jgi:hypothetical protein
MRLRPEEEEEEKEEEGEEEEPVCACVPYTCMHACMWVGVAQMRELVDAPEDLPNSITEAATHHHHYPNPHAYLKSAHLACIWQVSAQQTQDIHSRETPPPPPPHTRKLANTSTCRETSRRPESTVLLQRLSYSKGLTRQLRQRGSYV